MTDIKSFIKDQIRSEKQKRKSLQIFEARKSIFQASTILSSDANLKHNQGQNLIKMETIDSVSSKNLDENQDQTQIQIEKSSENDQQSVNKSQIEDLLKNQVKTPQFKCKKRQDIFELMIEEERKQQGAIVIKFGNQLQIQPKFMKIRGTMCSTELWSMRQKKDLCCEYIQSSQLEKGKTEKTSTQQSKILILNGLNKNSPFELNQFIDSRKYKMPMSDRISGISYFKPEKMISQADIYMQLQQEKQGMSIKRYSIAESIFNQLNTRIPIDLKYRSQSGETTFMRQTASSTQKLIQKNQIGQLNSPITRSRQSEQSPLYSPLSTANQSTFSSQIQRISDEQSTRKSILKQTSDAKQQSFSDKMRSKYKSLKSSRSTNSVNLSTQDLSSNITFLKSANSNFYTDSQFPKTDRITELQNYSSQSNFSEYILSPKSKTLGFKSIDATDNYPNQEFGDKSQAENTNLQIKDQVKLQIDSLINQCNRSLLDNRHFERQIDQNLNQLEQNAKQYAKKIERKEKYLFQF